MAARACSSDFQLCDLFSPLQFGSFLTARLADEVKAEINAASASRAPGGENRRSQHRANGYYVATTYLPASYRASM